MNNSNETTTNSTIKKICHEKDLESLKASDQKEAKSLEAQVKRLEAQIVTLRQKNGKLTDEKRAIRAELEEKDSESLKYFELASYYEKEAKSSKALLAKSSKALLAKSSKALLAKSSKARVERLEGQLEARIRREKIREESLKGKDLESLEYRDQLRRQNFEYKKEAKSLKAQVEGLEARIRLEGSRKGKEADLEAQVKRKGKESKSLEAQVGRKGKESKSLEAQVGRKEKESKSLEAQVGRKGKESKSLKAQVGGLEARIRLEGSRKGGGADLEAQVGRLEARLRRPTEHQIASQNRLLRLEVLGDSKEALGAINKGNKTIDEALDSINKRNKTA